MLINKFQKVGNQVHPSPCHWHGKDCHTIPRIHAEIGVERVFYIPSISHTLITVGGQGSLLHWGLAPCCALILYLSHGSTHWHTIFVPPCQTAMWHHCRSLQSPYSQVYMGTFWWIIFHVPNPKNTSGTLEVPWLHLGQGKFFAVARRGCGP